MGTNLPSTGISGLTKIILLLTILIVAWNLYTGVSVKKIGIPGIFEIEFDSSDQTSTPKDNKAAGFEVVMGWGGSSMAPLFASFWVQVINPTSQDVYVSSIELERAINGGQCDWVPRFPPLAPAHPFVRAKDTVAVIGDLRIDGASQPDLAACGILTRVTLVKSATFPVPETGDNTVVVRSRMLGN